MMFDARFEAMSADELAQLQIERLQATLRRVYRNVAFYRSLFDERGINVEEVRDLALPVLRHRVIPNYNATGEGLEVEAIIAHLVDHTLQAS